VKCLRFHPEAQAEMVEAARYYEVEKTGLGKRFLAAVQAATQKIRLFPQIYQRVEGDVRRCCVERFPFGVIFRDGINEIQVIAVVHFKRAPGYWKKRV